MTAIREPGPHFYGPIEVGAENVDDWEVVQLRANNLATRTDSYWNRPVPSSLFLKWLRDSDIDPQHVKLSEYLLINMIKADPYFVVETYWLNVQHAIMFKLAWAGL